jgi:hypothetical protein
MPETDDEPHDKIFGPGEEDQMHEAAKKLDTRVLFDGRTVLVTAVFHTIVDPKIISERVRRAAQGPLLRMAIGGLQRRPTDHALLTKSFINTDEDVEIVAKRVAEVVPAPARVEGGLVSSRDAEGLWAEFHRSIVDGGD